MPRVGYFSGVGEIRPGLEGVVAFETTIAEPDKEGGALRYRGVDIEELVGRHPFEKVWGLLVDESFDPGAQWYTNHNVMGGMPRVIDSVVKWSQQAPSSANIYEMVQRAGEIAGAAGGQGLVKQLRQRGGGHRKLEHQQQRQQAAHAA